MRLPVAILPLVLAAASGATPAVPALWRVAQAEPSTPTLEDAVYLDSSVDRKEVYLGESLTLSLEYWELDFRGVRVQPHFKSARPLLPETEGFYAGEVQVGQRDATRGGALYRVTTYRQELYPARSGDLRVGAWNWTGTVRGHTAEGTKSLPLDIATSPIQIRVRPLPEPPVTFAGAVGEFEIALEFETRDLSRGVPVGLFVDVSGRGNPHAIQAPPLPEEPWFNLGDPRVEAVELEPGEGGRFTKRFRMTFMPLGGGEHIFPPLSMTYFSPSEARYKASRTLPVKVTIEASGPEETLVVIGGGGGGASPNMLAMDGGRLPLVAAVTDFRMRQSRGNLAPILAVVPPLLFLIALIVLRGPAAVQGWARRAARRDRDDARLAEVESHARPLDALNAVLREILTARMGRDMACMSVPEIRACLSGAVEEEAAAAIASVLHACAACRYGGATANAADLVHRARTALAQMPPSAVRGGAAR